MKAHYLASAAMLVGLTACMVGTAEEETLEAESAFGEATCATTALNSNDANGGNPDPSVPVCWNWTEWTSSNASYGHTDCTRGFVVEYTNYSGTDYELMAEMEPGRGGMDQNACGNAVVELRTYAADGTLLSATSDVGNWVNGTCSLPMVQAPGYNVHRAVARAYIGWIPFVYKQVVVGRRRYCPS